MVDTGKGRMETAPSCSRGRWSPTLSAFPRLKILLLVKGVFLCSVVQGLRFGWEGGAATQTPSGNDSMKAKQSQETSQSSPIASSKEIMGEVEVVGQVSG